ncbi:acetate kinase [Klebsiella pneumoniae]|uniref:Acetate kinase n=1 Tax=Klebsiella pneumoniae TaxID=573 RepID=A0A2X3GWM2_KLEPN|nr:acetate kinase [Klebsiella pneumoniae]
MKTPRWCVSCRWANWGVLGFEVDHERNLAARFGKSGFINKEGTRPAVVIPTNEELVIAQDASRLTA